MELFAQALAGAYLVVRVLVERQAAWVVAAGLVIGIAGRVHGRGQPGKGQKGKEKSAFQHDRTVIGRGAKINNMQGVGRCYPISACRY